MTRDEARPIAKAIILILAGGAVYKSIDATADSLLDKFEMLGMVKLEEPKVARLSLEERVRDVFFDFKHEAMQNFGRISSKRGLDLLEAAGLQIVEKPQASPFGQERGGR